MSSLLFLISNILSAALFAVFFSWAVFATSSFLKKLEKKKNFKPVGVSVIIPAFNEEARIGECLKSIKNSSYPKEKIEVIVVDDGSNDRTAEVAKIFGAKVIRQKHRGKVAALNFGISKAKYDYVITLDADTILQKSTIKELVKEISADTKIGAVSGVVKARNKNSILSTFQNIEYLYLYFIKRSFSAFFKESLGICGALACFNRKVLEMIGGFHKNTFSEDFDVSMLIRKAGYRVVFSDKAIGETFVENSLNGLIKQRIRWGRGILQSLKKNFDVFLSRKFGVGPLYFSFLQLFWYFYAFFALPTLAFQFFYWLPYNSQTVFDVIFYIIRWLSLLGPIYILYMMQYWGFSLSNFLAASAGLFTVSFMIISSLYFKDKFNFKKVLAIFFYFPYVMLLNVFNVFSVILFFFSKSKNQFFIKPSV
jgi:biofilm PGA synthesis N-glycosyltransferase PgaC